MDEPTGEIGSKPVEALRTVGLVRIGLGLAQGLVLYALTEAFSHKLWPISDPVVRNALASAAFFAPLVLIAGLTAFRRPILVGWTLGSAVIAAGLAAYGVWSNLGDPTPVYGTADPLPLEFKLIPLTAAILFIANHLLEGAEIDRRFVARYPNYFDPAWKHGVQGALSILFTGAFWMLLQLGGELFRLIKINLVADLIAKPWFAWPATGMAFAAAVHLTDVRPVVVRSVRMVALTLLSWLTPVLALLTGAFVLTLPFTGLQPLWQTRAAAAILLSAASALVLLINAAYQDGEGPTPLVLRWAVRAASVILVPLVVLAAIGLGVRVQQHGLTAERIIAMAWALVAVAYGGGYAFAAVRPGAWMKPLERTNVVAAWLILLLVALLFTPIADPTRLSVADQVGRLERGRIAPDQFDYAYLRFGSARFGREALAGLAAGKGAGRDPVVAEAARAEQKVESRYNPNLTQPGLTPERRAAQITVYPKGASLPDGFAAQRDWSSVSGWLPGCLNGKNPCDAFLIDLDGDGAPEVLIPDGDPHSNILLAFKRGDDGVWAGAGTISSFGCSHIIDDLKAGRFTTAPPRWRDLKVGADQVRLHMELTGIGASCKAAQPAGTGTTTR